uniref:Uncharacterized protein n=1 Tax=Trichogramma kaykai TaxID=54128 RepID=A0ABD2W3G9_9HYME
MGPFPRLISHFSSTSCLESAAGDWLPFALLSRSHIICGTSLAAVHYSSLHARRPSHRRPGAKKKVGHLLVLQDTGVVDGNVIRKIARV